MSVLILNHVRRSLRLVGRIARSPPPDRLDDIHIWFIRHHEPVTESPGL